MLDVKFLRKQPEAILPSYAHPNDAGLDLFSTISCKLMPSERRQIPVGWGVGLPPGYEGQVRPRSGLANNNGITVLNSPGTIDEGFTGEIEVTLINLGNAPYEINKNDKIAQLVIMPIPRINLIVVDSLPKTIRGNKGHGSTG